jgi:hypothetical protein
VCAPLTSVWDPRRALQRARGGDCGVALRALPDLSCPAPTHSQVPARRRHRGRRGRRVLRGCPAPQPALRPGQAAAARRVRASSPPPLAPRRAGGVCARRVFRARWGWGAGGFGGRERSEALHPRALSARPTQFIRGQNQPLCLHGIPSRTVRQARRSHAPPPPPPPPPPRRAGGVWASGDRFHFAPLAVRLCQQGLVVIGEGLAPLPP